MFNINPYTKSKKVVSGFPPNIPNKKGIKNNKNANIYFQYFLINFTSDTPYLYTIR